MGLHTQNGQPLRALPGPSRIPPGPRTHVDWGGKKLPAKGADEGFYRICGVQGSGKTHLTKLFITEALKELRDNPYAKLVVYEPKREFYAWLSSLGLPVPIHYFLPSDARSVALDFMRDYPSDQDSKTLAFAFYPDEGRKEDAFWSKAFRTIYAQVCDAIKRQLGRFDLRLMCLVLEDEGLMKGVLDQDPYLIQARILTQHGGGLSRNETAENINKTIQSRIAEMKVLAAHLERARADQAREGKKPFSLRDFIERPGAGVLAISRDATYSLVQDPMNGLLLWRLIQLLDAEQAHRQRKVFVVLDEFPILAGDQPCPGIHDLFTRLRSRGVTVLITYQAHATLKRVYGDQTANIVGLCSNIMYMRQADVESAKYAADDLGWERGYEEAPPSWQHGPSGSTYSTHQQWYDRPIFSFTELKGLLPARPEYGVTGKALTAELTRDASGNAVTREKDGTAKSYQESSGRPWHFNYTREEIDEWIPAISDDHKDDYPEYVKRDPQFKEDVEGDELEQYFELIKKTQRIAPFTDEEREALLHEREKPRARRDIFLDDPD